MKAKFALFVILSAFVHISSAETYVYVGNSQSNDISVFSLNTDNGHLAFITSKKIPDISKSGFSTPLAISPDKKRLYVASRGEPQMISAFNINQKNGQLSHIANSQIDSSLAYITIDQTGQHILGASYPHHKIISHPIEQSGVQQGKILEQQQALDGLPNAHAIVLDQSNQFVFVPSLGNNQIAQFLFDANTGELTANKPAFVQLPGKVGPRHLVLHPTNKFGYLIGEFDAAIHVFDFNPDTGLLNRKQTIDTLANDYDGPRSAADIHITDDGQFVYSSERKTSSISVFKVDQKTGLLSFVDRIQTEQKPRGFTLTPSGKYLIAAGQDSNHIASYEIDQHSGKLKFIKRYPVGEMPNWIEVVHLP